MKLVNLLLILGIFHTTVFAQGITIGLKLNTEEAYNGYTLYTPIGSNNTWLIDNCGYKVNEWQHSDTPELCAYLLPDGNLLRSTHVGQNDVTKLEIVDWDNNPVWTGDMSGIGLQHHDMEILPNGNILTIIEDPYPDAMWVERGRDPNSLPFLFDFIWSERIVEIEPLENNDFQIVWEWKAWDHLIQDFDSTKSNYGVIAEHPGKLDVNAIYEGIAFGWSNDWLHINGIDFNSERDEIILSSRHISEVFIIDHSTTTAEAASETGGTSGKGGELLWRWGKPENYGQGSADDRRLYGQHNPSFIPDNYELYGGMISIFNNGDFRPEGNYTTIEIVDPVLDNDGNYAMNADGRFLPEEAYYTYQGTIDGSEISSQFVGGVNVQPNGNLLICEGMTGRFIEVTPEEELAWFYISPDGGSIANQGSFVANPWNFRAERYGADFEGFIGKDMTPYALVENENSISNECTIYEEEMEPSSVEESVKNIYIYPNPAHSYFNVDRTDGKILLTDILGNTSSIEIRNGRVNVENLVPGHYLFRIGDKVGRFVKI